MKIFEINPSIKLSNVPIFRIVVVALPLIAAIITLTIVLNSDLKLDLSYAGFNAGFFTVLRVPFAILAAWITSLGVIFAIHRSAQATLQIEKTTEQNTFANFYKHRQEYIDHLKELKDEIPEHIGNSMTEKVIRGFYCSTYPQNSVSNFSTKPDLIWVEHFDRLLIELCYFLVEMKREESQNPVIFLRHEYLIRETSIRQGLFSIRKPEDARVLCPSDKMINVDYWTGPSSVIRIDGQVLKTLYTRVCDYAGLLTKLKNLADEFEGTILYGTDVYSSLSIMNHHDELEGEDNLFGKLYSGVLDRVSLSEEDSETFSKLVAKIGLSYDKKMKEIDSIKTSIDGRA